MSFGIDTFRTHLDNNKINYSDFRMWNGATLQDGKLDGGLPVFAGRNFLGGDFIWGHAEATNASSEPDGAHYPLAPAAPSPEHPENLDVFVERIAPIQAPQPLRQQVLGNKGRTFGRIDADALCKRLKACILSGEFAFPQSHVFVWLSVDPNVGFSADYWAGWADTVNNATIPIRSQGVLLAEIQPFKASILCRYSAPFGGVLRPDPRVTAALAQTFPGLNTRAHARWADFKIWDDAPADLVANGSPLLDWNMFDPLTVPLLWRFAHGFTKASGAPAGVPFDIDGVNPASDLSDFWLDVERWQPNVPSLQKLGFSNTDPISAANIQCVRTTDLPQMSDINFKPNIGHFSIPGGQVSVIGRYIRHNHDPRFTMSAAEAQSLSDAGLELFTVWEGVRNLGGGMGDSEPHLRDLKKFPVETWGPFNKNFHKYIFYFDPDPDRNPATRDDAGTLDAQDAFQYCATVLKQPSHTPVFFAIDFDPHDLPDPQHPPHPAGTPQPPAPPGWPTLPIVHVREEWIEKYFNNVKTVRDEFASRTGRYYLIGVYCVGRTLQLLYEQGVVSHFWQAASNGRSGSHPPRWPWYHANRWQYQVDQPYCAMKQTDPDADWGDGGTWSLADPLTKAMIQLELLEHLNILDDPSVLLADLEPSLEPKGEA